MAELADLTRSGRIASGEAQRMSSEYERQLRAANERIGILKQQVQARLAMVRPAMGAYDGELRRLACDAQEERISAQQYQEEMARILGERAALAERERVPLLEALLRAETPQELDGMDDMAPDGETSPIRAAWEVGMRRANIAVAAAIMIAAVLPFFCVSITSVAREGDSLFRAAYAGLGRSSLSLLFVICPLALAAGTGFSSLIRNHRPRALVLLGHGAVAVSAAAILVAIAISYPSPAASDLYAMLVRLGAAEPGLVLMMACVLCLYALAMKDLVFSRRGVLALAVAFGAPILTGTLAWGYCYATSDVKAVISLNAHVETETELMPKAQVEIEVANKGSVPLYIEKRLEEAMSPAQFAVDIQEHADGAWMGMGIPLESAAQAEGDAIRVPPKRILRLTGSFACARSSEGLSLRAILTGVHGAEILSNEITVTLPKPPSPVAESNPAVPDTGPVEPAVEPDASAEIENARVKVEQLQRQLAQDKASTVSSMLRETREAIDKIPGASDREPLNRMVDSAILSAKEREASDILRRANEAFNNEAYDRAASMTRDVLDVFAREPLPVVLTTSDTAAALQEEARNLLDTAGQAGNPELRFTLTGIMRLGDGRKGAFLNDNVTGESLRVGEGDRLRQWQVEKVTAGSVVLVNGTESWELRK